MPDIILFGDREPDVYKLADIYDPDIHGVDPVAAEANGKFVPAVGSAVFDMSNSSIPGHPIPGYVVRHVDLTTYKAYLVPMTSVLEIDNIPDRILSYGNDTYVLFYDDRTNPSNLRIDGNLMLFGNNSVEYRLVKRIEPVNVRGTLEDGSNVVTDVDYQGHHVYVGMAVKGPAIPDDTVITTIGSTTFSMNHAPTADLTNVSLMVGDTGREIISMHQNSSGEYVGDRVPITETPTPGLRRGADCYTSNNLEDDEIVIMEVYDAEGILSMTVELLCKRAAILNDLESATDIVTGFDAECNQKQGNDWIIYVGQNVDNLSIWPELTFVDGQRLVVPVDNMSSFVYGLDEVKTEHPGLQYQLLFKYFLCSNLQSTIAEGEHTKFVTKYKTLKVVSEPEDGISKISVLPYWDDSGAGEYKLRFYAYFQSRDDFQDVTANVTYSGGSFNGTLINNTPDPDDDDSFNQELTIEVDEAVVGGGTGTFSQTFFIHLKPWGSNEPYQIWNATNPTLIYGQDDASHSKPMMWYDDSIEQYFFPTSEFVDEAKFLEFFFINGDPPYLPGEGETQSPTPTHFIVRKADNGQAILVDAIATAQYDQPFNLVLQAGNTDPGQYEDTDLVVEFLVEDGELFKILYGVPIYVKAGTYNTP